MIPILYGADEGTYTTNGIGRLADAISCTVSEELNGAYELNMTYPVTGAFFSELENNRIILAKPADTGRPQPFRIKKISKPLNGRVQVYCQHKSYDLNGFPVLPFEEETGIYPALDNIEYYALMMDDYSFWTDNDNAGTPFSNKTVQSVRALLGGTRGSILDAFKQIEYEFDRNVIKVHMHRGSDKGVSIRYGKNLTDLMHETSSEAVYTGVIAQWIDDENGICVYGDIQYISESEPSQKIFILDCTQDFEEQPTADQLNNRALKYISDNHLDTPNTNITISFVPLWQTEEYKNVAVLERVSMGDTVHVYYSDFDINVTAEVIKTVYDVLKERYTSVELGNAKSSLSKTIKQATGAEIASTANALASSVRATQSSIATSEQAMEIRLAQALEEAGNLITGGTGGYVYISRNADGEPNEIYLLDTPDRESATNVIRMNYEGIAGSTTGVNGPWNFAILIDGQINANQITTGQINGNLVRAASILTSALEVNAQDAVAGVNQYFRFLSDGLHVGQSGAEYSSLFSNLGMRVVNSSNEPTLVAEEDTVTANNLTANTYLRITGALATARFQTYHDNVDGEDMFGCYWEDISA